MTPPDIQTTDVNRRTLLTKIAYVAPLVVTLAAFPAFASKGSSKSKARSEPRSMPGRRQA